MRIAFFTDVYRPTINGVVVSIDSFAAELRALGHQVTIICPTYPEMPDDEPDVLRVSAVTFPTYKEYRLASPISTKIDRHMRENVYDVIHIHSPFSIGLAGIFYAKRYRVPIVYTAHTNYADYRHYVHGGGLIPQVVIDKMASSFSNGIDMTIAPSRKIADSLIRYGTTKEVVILPTGIPAPVKGDRAAFKKKHDLGRSVNFMYLGRVTKEKNLEFLIEAFAIAAPDLPSASKLFIAGDGPYFDEIKQLVDESGVADRVVFVGFVSGQERADAFSAADVMCHVSYSETQGLTLLEASSYGLPLVVSDDTAYEGVAVAGKNAFVVGRDVTAYAKRLVEIAHDKELRERMGVNSKELSKTMTIEAQAVKLVDAYRAMIATKRVSVVNGDKAS